AIRTRGSRFFVAQVQLVGAGGDEQGDVAEPQLGVAEEGGVGGGGEGAGDLCDKVVGALADGVGEFLGKGFLLGGERGQGHGASLATRGVDFWPRGRSDALCTRIPPTVETPTRTSQAWRNPLDHPTSPTQ